MLLIGEAALTPRRNVLASFASRLAVIDLEEAREAVLEFETTVNFLDPTEEVEIAFRLVDLVFPEPAD